MAGLIHVYCGDGKGKTTASVGLAVRAAGAGMRVLFTQFFKDGSSSEVRMLQKMENIQTMHCGGTESPGEKGLQLSSGGSTESGRGSRPSGVG